MIILTIFLSIIVIFLVIFLHFYYWAGRRARALISQLPGYSEGESWILSYEAAIMASEDVKNFLDKHFGKFSSISSIWFLGVPNVNIKSPQYLEVLLKSIQHIAKGREYHSLKPWLGQGLLTSKGSKWHANRKMLTPAFHFRILQSCLPIFNHHSQVLVKILKENCRNNGETTFLDKFIPSCSLDIISETAMGVQLDAQLHKQSTLDYVNAVRRMGELILNRATKFYLVKDWIYALTSEGREQKKLLKILHNFTESVIKKSKEKRRKANINGLTGQQPAAFVDFLLEMAEKEPGIFTDTDIRQEVDTFMFEGHETTASSISWSLLLLGHDQAVQEKAYSELVTIFGNSDRDITKQDLDKMIYLEAVIKESLRLYPPVSFMSRKLESDLRLEKYTIPSDSNIFILPYFIHRQSNLYPDPEKFDPERFLNVDYLTRHPFMYIPFSGGPRNCIGQKFAMMEMKVVISNILRNFKIKSITKREGLPLLYSPILRPKNGTYVELYSRV